MSTRYWLGVVSRDHVRRGVELGFAQANHGKRAAVERMKAGDGLVYYSPRTGMREGEPIKSFTAIGTVADGPAWQVEEQGGCFRPWRRGGGCPSPAPPRPHTHPRTPARKSTNSPTGD
ncbi:EVE domain-containing protein, partial [Nocardia sp. NPDC059229]|uniref:EVE domain-containing protein n=1 Tax=Nocardia sp. NPDC059229 TaxID=3346778 RepID=UPI0036BB3927